jgi:hypothetical protein
VTWQAHLTEPAKGWVERQPREKNRRVHPACLPRTEYTTDLFAWQTRSFYSWRAIGTGEMLHLFLEFPPGHQNATATRRTDRSNIGSQAHDTPFVPAARMGFAQTGYVIQTKVQHPSTSSLGAHRRATCPGMHELVYVCRCLQFSTIAAGWVTVGASPPDTVHTSRTHCEREPCWRLAFRVQYAVLGWLLHEKRQL